MKSNLKRIYDSRDSFDIFNNPRYHLLANPIYQVNRFINKIDERLNKNFIENLKDIKIEKETITNSASDYDYNNNTLYCKNSKADVFGLLNVASNDRSKPNTGIILKDGTGYAINKGLTELFTHNINNKRCVFPFETIIAKALAAIESEVIADCYFKNSGNILIIKNSLLKEFMVLLDNYHVNYLKLINLYSEKWKDEFVKLKFNERKKRLEMINEEIYDLEKTNFSLVVSITDYLINIIDNAFIEDSEKKNIFLMLSHEFDLLLENEKFYYLCDFSFDFEMAALTKRRVK